MDQASREHLALRIVLRAKREKSLALYINGLSLLSLPEKIGELPQLQRLGLASNQLKTIPSSIFSLVELERLGLAHNQIETLSPEIQKLKKLTGLGMGHNKLRKLPDEIGQLKELISLRLGHNNLEELPATLLDLPNLTQLDVRGNPTLGLPEEVVETRDAKQILNFYFRLKSGKQKEIGEVKVLFVGRGAVGKTSLIRRLMGENFDAHETATHGIRINDLILPLAVDDSKPSPTVRAHIWDFGGQEIMHATHQFFLTRRSVYVLVLAGRDDRVDEDAEYWLRVIASLGGESPVVVVRNKIDSEPFELDEPTLRETHSNIASFVATDAETSAGIEDLRRTLIRTIGETSGVHELFPAAWFRVKEALQTDRRSWMNFNEFRKLCSTCGEEDPSRQEELALWLHVLGIALNYRDDRRLSDTTVLDPHWVTRGIYAIITSPTLFRKGGVFSIGDVASALSERSIPLEDYPTQMQQFLVELMRKFELCYPLDGQPGNDLIPELLPKAQPSAVRRFPKDGCTWLRYRYHVLPEGLIPRFVTRMHLFIEDNAQWRRGAILQHEGARALVVGSDYDRTVTIRVRGDGEARYRLLAMIRSDFASLHGELKGVKPIEETAPEDQFDLWVQVDELRALESKGTREQTRAVHGETIDVPISAQLNRIEPAETRKRFVKAAGKDRGFDDVIDEDAGFNPVRVFLSYSHDDEKIRRRDLAAVLKVLENEKLIDVWCDRMIVAGDDWDKEIRQEVKKADLILFLVSREFLISNYIRSVEAKIALERASRNDGKITAIVHRLCTWQSEPWAKFQVLPVDAKGLKPVQDWKPQTHAWHNVEVELRKTAKKIISERKSTH